VIRSRDDGANCDGELLVVVADGAGRIEDARALRTGGRSQVSRRTRGRRRSLRMSTAAYCLAAASPLVRPVPVFVVSVSEMPNRLGEHAALGPMQMRLPGCQMAWPARLAARIIATLESWYALSESSGSTMKRSAGGQPYWLATHELDRGTERPRPRATRCHPSAASRPCP